MPCGHRDRGTAGALWTLGQRDLGEMWDDPRKKLGAAVLANDGVALDQGSYDVGDQKR